MSSFLERLRADKDAREAVGREQHDHDRAAVARHREERSKLDEDERQKRVLAAKFLKESEAGRIIEELHKLLPHPSYEFHEGYDNTNRGLKWYVAPSFFDFLRPKKIETTKEGDSGTRVREDFMVSANHLGELLFVGRTVLVLPRSEWSTDSRRIENYIERSYENPRRTLVEIERPGLTTEQMLDPSLGN